VRRLHSDDDPPRLLKRWTIGRRAAWDGLWQLLLWLPGEGREVARLLVARDDLVGVLDWIAARRGAA
jgi:hypothetical protein